MRKADFELRTKEMPGKHIGEQTLQLADLMQKDKYKIKIIIGCDETMPMSSPGLASTTATSPV